MHLLTSLGEAYIKHHHLSEVGPVVSLVGKEFDSVAFAKIATE